MEITLKQKLYDLKNRKQEAIDKAKSFVLQGDLDSEAYKAQKAEIDRLNGQIGEMETLIAEEEKGVPDQPDLHGFMGAAPEKNGYQEAVKSFADAARTGFRVTKAAGDLMQEGVDADGGYTVPEDIVTRIVELREAKESLLGEVTVEHVTTASGRRTFKTRAQHSGFATVAEAAKFGKTETPQFTTLTYNIEKRGGYLPVTNELLADSDGNIAATAENWLADEARVTANNEILAVVAKQTATNLTDLDGILTAWICLGSCFRATSKLLTNDDGLAWLSTLKDTAGRYLLSPNPADSKQLQLCAGPHILPVKTYDNCTLPTTDGKIPMILGDLKEGVVYWDRRAFSVKVSDVAVVGDLNAFEQDLTIWRGSLRDDCTLRDNQAFINGYITSTASAAEG